MIPSQSSVILWVKSGRRLGLWITFIVIAILAYLLMEALQRETVRAERAAFDKVIAEMQAALLLKTAALVAADNKRKIKNFANSDPMDWMNPPPVNYSGKINENYEKVMPGYWFYSINEQLIIYRVRNSEALVLIQGEEPDYIRFQVTVDFLDKDNDGVYSERVDRLKGLTLKRVLPKAGTD